MAIHVVYVPKILNCTPNLCKQIIINYFFLSAYYRSNFGKLIDIFEIYGTYCSHTIYTRAPHMNQVVVIVVSTDFTVEFLAHIFNSSVCERSAHSVCAACFEFLYHVRILIDPNFFNSF